MDVVALAQLGFANAVATLGTACTAEHVAKLFRFTDSVVFSFDGDAAGRARRGARARSRAAARQRHAHASASCSCRRSTTPTRSSASTGPTRSSRCVARRGAAVAAAGRRRPARAATSARPRAARASWRRPGRCGAPARRRAASGSCSANWRGWRRLSDRPNWPACGAWRGRRDGRGPRPSGARAGAPARSRRRRGRPQDNAARLLLLDKRLVGAARRRGPRAAVRAAAAGTASCSGCSTASMPSTARCPGPRCASSCGATTGPAQRSKLVDVGRSGDRAAAR